MVNFDTDCFYVSQLKKGYMLRKTGIDKFRVIRTGYPYPDTPMLSQDMVNSLVSWLGIDREVSVAELASYFDPVYDVDPIGLSKDELKSVIENRGVGVLGSYTGFSIFFNCQFFSIYYIDDMENSSAVDRIREKFELTASKGNYWKSGFILHFHKGKQDIKLGVGTPAEEFDIYKKFLYVFEKVALLPADELRNYLDILYSSLPDLKLSVGTLNPYSKVEYFVFKPLRSDSFDSNGLMQTFKSLYSTVASVLGLHTLCYKSRTLTVSPVRTVLEGIWGYNVFSDLSNTLMPQNGEMLRGEYLNISLLCCIISCTDDQSLQREYQAKLKDCVNAAVKALVSKGYFAIDVDVMNGNVVVLYSPHVYWFYSNLMDELTVLGVFVLRGKSGYRKLINSDKFGVKFAENLGYILSDYVSSFENKLFQYFLMSFNVFGINKIREGHTEFSLRNILKTIIPAFDRKVMLGGITETSFDKIFLRHYKTTPPALTKLPIVLDNALDETSIFEEYEKSFICYLSYLEWRVVNENPYRVACQICDGWGFDALKDTYIPSFSSEQLDKFSIVFKLGALALLYSRCDDVSVFLKDYEYSLSYASGVFTMEFKEK